MTRRSKRELEHAVADLDVDDEEADPLAGVHVSPAGTVEAAADAPAWVVEAVGAIDFESVDT